MHPTQKILVSHPTGNSFVRGLLYGLNECHALDSFHTTVGFDLTANYLDWLPETLKKQISKRTYKLPANLIKNYPLIELIRLTANRLKLTSLTNYETSLASVDSLYNNLDENVARYLKSGGSPNLTSVYCYEDGAKHTFKAAHDRGLQTCYELPIGYWKVWEEIQAEELEINPDWAKQFLKSKHSLQKNQNKDTELKLADIIFVASTFVKKTLEQAPIDHKKIRVVPYGSGDPNVDFTDLSTPLSLHRENQNKLKVLYVGQIQQRKGISYLFDAIDRVENLVSLTLIGPKVDSHSLLEKNLGKHCWKGVLTHSEVLAEMRNHDVFVFPSLFEGFGLVLPEAMGQGMTIIATPNTAAPDLIENGKEGFIVPIRSSEEIAEKLELLAKNPDRLLSMREAARNKAAKHTWKQFANRVYSEICRLKV